MSSERYFEYGTVIVDGVVYDASRDKNSGKMWYYSGSRTIRATRRIGGTFKMNLPKPTVIKER